MVEAVPPRLSARRTRPRWAVAALAFVAVVLLAPGAPATIVVAKDFAALCAEADLVFVGTVTGVQSRWSDPSKQAIETVVTFGDLTWLRGAPRASVALTFGGGEIDGLHEVVAGVPQFKAGERRVIFAHDGNFVSPLVGFDQGAFSVVDGADGPVVIGTTAAPVASGALRLGTPDNTGGQPVPLDAFLDTVRRQLASPSAGAP